MSDLDFENRLERMFAQTPAFADSGVFARRVEARLDRSWTLRRLAIGVAGLVGGLVFALQMIGSRLGAQVEGISAGAANELGKVFAISPQWKAFSYLPYSGEVLWMGAALAVLAVALMATRSIEEF